MATGDDANATEAAMVGAGAAEAAAAEDGDAGCTRASFVVNATLPAGRPEPSNTTLMLTSPVCLVKSLCERKQANNKNKEQQNETLFVTLPVLLLRCAKSPSHEPCS